MWLQVHAWLQCRGYMYRVASPVVGKAHLVSSVLGVNDPVIIQVKQVCVAVPVISLTTPVCLFVVDQLPCVLCHKLVSLDVLLQVQRLPVSRDITELQSDKSACLCESKRNYCGITLQKGCSGCCHFDRCLAS